MREPQSIKIIITATASLNIRLNYRQILELARQLSDEDKLDKQDMKQKDEIRIIIDTSKDIPLRMPNFIYIFHLHPCHPEHCEESVYAQLFSKELHSNLL